MEQACQPIFFQRVETTDVEDAVADRSFIVKIQASDIQQHPTDCLGDQRHIQNLASSCSLIEANLIPENRLADAGRSFDDIQTASEEAAIQNIVEAFNPAKRPPERPNVTTHGFPQIPAVRRR